MRGLAAAAAMILGACPIGAAGFSSSARGTTTAEFLRLGVGARAVAMGEAYTAVAGEADALYWNPAGLTRLEGRSATFMHAAYLAATSFDYGAYAQKAGQSGALGLGVQYFSAGTIAQTDEVDARIGNFSPYDLALTAGGAYAFDGGLLPGWSAGLAAKFIRARILRTAQTCAVDAGLLSPAALEGRLRLGLAAANMGGTMRFEREAEGLPMVFKLGGAFQISDDWLLSADLASPKNDGPYAALGTEYWFVPSGPLRLAGRAGFNSKTLGSVDGLTGASFGVGIGYAGGSLDYSFVPMGQLGFTHRISLSFKWGGSRLEAKPPINIEEIQYPIHVYE